MSYTNAQVAALVRDLTVEIRALRAAVVATPATSSTTAPTVETIAIPVERAPKAAKVGCTLHADHKDGRGFSPAGMASHRAWCKDGLDFTPAPVAS